MYYCERQFSQERKKEVQRKKSRVGVQGDLEDLKYILIKECRNAKIKLQKGNWEL